MTDRAKMTPDNTRSGFFDRIYRAYQAELLGFFRRRAHDPHAADDLVNTVYVQLLKSQPKSPIRDHRAYLFQCARRVLSRENRRARQRDAQTVSGDPQLWDRIHRTYRAYLTRRICLIQPSSGSPTILRRR